VAGAPAERDLAQLLEAAGFEQIAVLLKPESESYIKEWLPGSGAENYVCAANVTAVKPACLPPASATPSKGS